MKVLAFYSSYLPIDMLRLFMFDVARFLGEGNIALLVDAPYGFLATVVYRDSSSSNGPSLPAFPTNVE